MKKILLIIILQLIFVDTSWSQALENKLTNLNQTIDKNIDMRKENKPRIAVSASNYDGKISASKAYIESVVKAGAEPIIVPTLSDVNMLRSIMMDVDGLVLIGGVDFDPEYYNQKAIEQLGEVDSVRDISDLTLIKIATDLNMPILGICRGEQGLNVALGGSLYQDIPTEIKTTIKHQQKEKSTDTTHGINIVSDSKLAKILGTTTIKVNSFHHQSVKNVAPNFRAVAHSKDGVIEAIEGYPHRNIMAVQWHPELLVVGGDTLMLKLFENLVTDAKTYRKAKEIHRRILSLDSHVDTPLNFKNEGYNFAVRDSGMVDLPKMQEGHLDAVFMAAYMGQGPRDKKSSNNAVEYISALINKIHQQASIHADLCGIATSEAELIKLKSEGKKALFIGIENGYGIGKDIENLQIYYDMGVRYMTLCHTKDNDICDTSSQTENEWGGLSPFGKKVIQEMNRLGIMIDVSHAGISTFNDVIKLSTKPIIASHSSVRSLCEHDRNLTDEQIKAIVQNNGVIQVCMVDMFINPDNTKASLEDAMEHIDHIVRIAGIDYVGIGSDFDGGGRLIGLEGTNDLINITVKLLERGYSEEDIAKIWGKNLLRVLNAQK